MLQVIRHKQKTRKAINVFFALLDFTFREV